MNIKGHFTALIVCCLILALYAPFSVTEAAVSSWQQGANIVPRYDTDFSSEQFKQSLQKLVATGANNISLVVPYYQSNIYSTDIQRGFNTPTDESLRAGIAYAKSLGLAVTLKVHLESGDGNWRANISPGDRDGWFRNYKNIVVHTARIGQEAGASTISIGTELVSIASEKINPDNTWRWQDIISQTRSVFSGKLIYGANSNDNSDNTFSNEKRYIGFWPQLDYIGLSTYYNLGWDSSVEGIKGGWDKWNNEDIKGFQAQHGKPLIIAEVGYRSIENSQVDPWNYSRGGNASDQTQANSYEALFSYWNNYDYVQGLYFWNWEPDPNAGWPGSTSYTPQNKPAEQVIKKWYTNASEPTQPPLEQGTTTLASSQQSNKLPGTPTDQYEMSGSISSLATIGQSLPLSVQVRNASAQNQNVLVDLEVYNPSDAKVHQSFYVDQFFAAGETKSYNVSLAPQQNGMHVVKVGVFAHDWSLYKWNNSVTQFNVGSTPSTSTSSGGSTGGSGSPSSGAPSSGSMASANLQIWWPTDGASIGGYQPFKAMLEGFSIDQYDMFWQVDTGQLNMMFDSQQDYPHKEAWVDLSGWKWKSDNKYTITFVVKNKATGSVEQQKSVQVYVY